MHATENTQTWLGHPRQLARLFSIEAWERFGFYGMRSLLILYLTYHFLIGERANSLVGGYLSLVYLTPLIGGWLADRYLGSKRSIKFGAIFMSIGYLLLCFGGPPAKPFAMVEGTRYDVTETYRNTATQPAEKIQSIVKGGIALRIHGRPSGEIELIAPDEKIVQVIPGDRFSSDGERSPFFLALTLIALSMVVVGNGFFKPNIATIVGSLYAPGDTRRDAGFTIFYWGINIGSIGSQMLCPILVDRFGWWAGFLLVAVGMLVAFALLHFDGGKLAGHGETRERQGKDPMLLIFFLAILAVPLIALALFNVMNTGQPAAGGDLIGYLLAQPPLGKALFLTFLAAVIGIPLWSWRSGTRTEAQMMTAAIILTVFNVTFWTLFEQAASSLTLFADRNTDLKLLGVSIKAAQTQNFNPLAVVILAPAMSWCWLMLARKRLEPSIQTKFGLALILIGLSFLVLKWSEPFANSGSQVSLWWLVLSYAIATIAELCISPVGLSMITKLSMTRVAGMMMGVWYLTMSMGEYFAGAMAQAAATQTVGGRVTSPLLSLRSYLHSFEMGGLATCAAGLLLLALTPLLKRLMHGVS